MDDEVTTGDGDKSDPFWRSKADKTSFHPGEERLVDVIHGQKYLCCRTGSNSILFPSETRFGPMPTQTEMSLHNQLSYRRVQTDQIHSQPYPKCRYLTY